MGLHIVTSRLWYPQLDIYDTARRIIALLLSFESSPGIERLCIADFFFANPPLLHKTSMPATTRKIFSALEIPRPEKSFISYPSALLLFHTMEPIQREAINALAGKGLISLESLRNGRVELTSRGKGVFPPNTICTDAEKSLGLFLAKSFAANEEPGNHDLRRRTGLRRAI